MPDNAPLRPPFAGDWQTGEVTRTGAAPVSYETVIARVIEAVPRIIPFDLAAALVVVEPARNASLLLHRQTESGEAALLHAKETAIRLVMVNGIPAVRDGRPTGARAGRALRKGAPGR